MMEHESIKTVGRILIAFSSIGFGAIAVKLIDWATGEERTAAETENLKPKSASEILEMQMEYTKRTKL